MHGAFRVRHHANHIAGLIADSRDIVHGAVRILSSARKKASCSCALHRCLMNLSTLGCNSTLTRTACLLRQNPCVPRRTLRRGQGGIRTTPHRLLRRPDIPFVFHGLGVQPFTFSLPKCTSYVICCQPECDISCRPAARVSFPRGAGGWAWATARRP